MAKGPVVLSRMHLAPDPSTHQHPGRLLQLLELRSNQSLQPYHYQPDTNHRKEDTILGTTVAIAMYLENHNNHFERSLDKSSTQSMNKHQEEKLSVFRHSQGTN